MPDPCGVFGDLLALILAAMLMVPASYNRHSCCFPCLLMSVQSEVDELRARRYQEAKDREWRAKERAAAERQAAMMADLNAAREAQTCSKLRLQADMAALEQAEFRRVLDVNQQKEAEEMSQVGGAGGAQALTDVHECQALTNVND